MPALNSWLDTPLGQHVLAREQAYFDQAVADVFGYHAVQFGLPDQPLLRENRMPWRCRAGESGAVDVTCDPAALPFASQSLDLLLLPHVLDFTSHPHQVLREAERVLVPEGRLMVTGFNPISLWGLARRCKTRDVMPWRANFIAPGRLKDWMQLLSLEPADCQHLCYAPPFEREAWRARWGFMERLGARWWPLAGGVYAISAVKRVRGMRLLAPRWSLLTPAPLAGVAARPAGQRGAVSPSLNPKAPSMKQTE